MSDTFQVLLEAEFILRRVKLELTLMESIVKKNRQSLDRLLAQQSPARRTEWLLYGDAGLGNAAEQLVRQARALQGIVEKISQLGKLKRELL